MKRGVRAEGGEIKGRRIIVADEDPVFVRNLVARLRARHDDVVVHGDADAVLRALTTTAWDALILEPNLVGATWYSLLARVRTLLRPGQVVVCTAYPSGALRDFSRDSGVRTYLVKPVDADHVIATLGQSVQWDHNPFLDNANSLAIVEWEHLNRTLLRNNGNMSATAKMLGVPRQTLYRKLRKHPPRRATARVRPALPASRQARTHQTARHA